MQDFIARLKDKYQYNENSKSGLTFTVNSRKPFQEAGSIDTDTRTKRYHRWRVGFEGKLVLAHRVVWILFYGEIPDKFEVDHIDGNALNNKIENLRLIDKEFNRRNAIKRIDNKTGYTGVYYHENGYMAAVKINKQYRTKYFSRLKYGEDLALKYAVEWRETQIKLLNEQGSGYTDRHGKE